MLAGGQGGEGLMPVGDVGDHPRQLDRLARPRTDQPAAHLKPATAVADLILGGVVAVPPQSPLQGFRSPDHVLGFQLFGEIARAEGLAAVQAEVFARPTGQPEVLSRKGQLPVADPARVDDGDQLVALIHHGDRQGQKQDEDGHARDRHGQHQGRGAVRVQCCGGLCRGRGQGRHGHMMHADYGQTQDQSRRQPPQRRAVLVDREQGGGGGEQGDDGGQDDQSGRIG
ncbi:hypothetical protein D3C87_1432670 [compost metagenome]